MRVGIVNDLRLAAEALRRTVAASPGLEVAWIARDGVEAVDLCASDPPDVVLMDLVMPTMDGVEATRRIMRDHPCPILVVTATVQGNLSMVYEAMSHGALDAVATPVLGRDGDLSGAEELVRKIATIGRLAGRDPAPVAARSTTAATRPATAARSVLLAIGSSTGGPGALARILRELPPDLPASVVLVQHVDRHFADGLAAWLDGQSGLRVRTIAPGDRPEPGLVLLAATNDHLVLGSDGRFRYTLEPVETPYRPSVDAFFESAARNAERPGCAVLLTGMGRDGAAGLLRLRGAGWHTIAQDEATSVVWGMPGAAVKLHAAVEVVAVDGIAARATAACRRLAAGATA